VPFQYSSGGLPIFVEGTFTLREQRFQEKQSLCHWRDGNKTPGEWYFIVWDQSGTWAFGPKEMQSPPSLSFRAQRGICFLCSSRKSRFLVAPLLGMTVG
jgi:hypothetical protein